MASKTSELSYLGIFIQCVGCITAIIELSHGSFEKQGRFLKPLCWFLSQMLHYLAFDNKSQNPDI